MIKRTIFAFFLLFSSLQAENKAPGKASQESIKSTGYIQNWAFAGSALALAALGIFVVGLDKGKAPPSTES